MASYFAQEAQKVDKEYKTLKVRCPDGKVRTARVRASAEGKKYNPPCQVQVKGASVSGRLLEPKEGDEYPYFFVDRLSVNADVFSPNYKTRKGWLKNPVVFVPDRPKPTVEVLTLADFREYGQEIPLRDAEVEAVAEFFRKFTGSVGVPPLSESEWRRIFRVLSKANEHYMLRSFRIRPWPSIELTGEWKREIKQLRQFLGSLT